jgi:hypothetical protein
VGRAVNPLEDEEEAGTAKIPATNAKSWANIMKRV